MTRPQRIKTFLDMNLAHGWMTIKMTKVHILYFCPRFLIVIQNVFLIDCIAT